MGSGRVTIAELAQELKLSVCTVSKVLNRSFAHAKYSEETIRRVNEKAQEMGYVPNPQARSLRTRKTMLVGFLLPSAQVSLFGALTDQIEMQLRPHGYQVLIAHSRNDPAIEQELAASLMARGIDGLIWIPSHDRRDMSVMGFRPDFPVMILDRPGCEGELPFVATDNRGASADLARRMRDLGHRRIFVLNAPEGDRSMSERFQGLADIFGEGMQVLNLANDSAQAKEAVIKFLRQEGGLPDALVALSELLAVGALAGLRDLELKIPEEISFAAFDDFPLASHWSPRLTLVRQDVEGLATSAVQMALQRMTNPAVRLDDIRVPAAVEWRDSVIHAIYPPAETLRTSIPSPSFNRTSAHSDLSRARPLSSTRTSDSGS